MALTDDQKAMLRLLAQREEGYEDIAALMGLSVDEVRARVKEALAEMGTQDSSASDQGSEFSAAGPVAGDGGALRAGASSTPPSPTPPAEEAKEPDAEGPAATPHPAPTSPEQPANKGPIPSTSRGARPGFSGLKLPKDRGALIGLGAGVLAVIALVLVLVLSGGDGDSGADSSSESGTDTTSTASNDKLTQAILGPSDGGDASGQALFGRFKNNVLLQVQAEGLDPSPQGESYMVWLYRSPKLALRVGSVPVDDSGKIAVQIPIPAEVLAYVAGGAFGEIDISLTDDAAYKAEVARAKSQQRLPRYTGTSILRGEITGPAIKASTSR